MTAIAWIGVGEPAGAGGAGAPAPAAGVPGDRSLLGGKGAGLAALVSAGLRVPPAFVVTTEAFRRAVGAGVRAETAARLAAVAENAGLEELEEAAAAARALVLNATAGDLALRDEVAAAHERLAGATGAAGGDAAVAVRSSSAAEDAADQSFAGEHDTYLWVRGADEVHERVRQCWASLFTARAVGYRRRADATMGDPAMAVVVQVMVPARAAGVFMTLNPANGDRSKVVIESVWGLGEPLVSGAVNPDRFTVDKVTGDVVRREVADKPTQAACDPATGRGVATVPVDEARRAEPSLTGAEIAEIVRVARLVERRAGTPQDGEFAVTADAAAPDNVLLLQSRPETAWSRRAPRSVAQGRSALEAVVATLARGAQPEP